MRCLFAAAPLSFVVLAACATTETAPSGPPPEWRFASASMSIGNTLQGTGGSGGQVSVQIDGRNLTGPTTKLFVGGGAIRGTSNIGKTVQVTIQGEKAQGIVANSAFTCIVATNPDGSARVTGLMGARNTDFTISPKEINGRVSGVTYNLAWTGERYEGRMDPGGAAFLSLPAVMATWTNTEVACVLSILLT
jgi:hypothetical protein